MERLHQARLDYSQRPKMFAGARLDDFDDKYTEPVFNFISGDGWRSLVIIGPIGVGKTHMGCSIIHEWTKNKSALYTTALSMSREIIHAGPIKYIEPSLLVIDEVGRQFDTEAEKQRVFEVVNERYQNERPTAFIGNVRMKDFADLMGAGALDRILESHDRVIFSGESRRQK